MKKIKIILATCFCMVFGSCTDVFEELNTPSNLLVSDKLDIGNVGQVFATTQYNAMHMSGYEISQNLFSDLFSQYFTLLRVNFYSDRYVDVASWSNANFTGFYTSVAKDLSFVEKYTAEKNFPLQNAVIKVWKVQAFHRLTDYYGPIPYLEVGNGATSVPYDPQEAIYKDFFKTLDEAVAILKQNKGASVFSRDDLVFSGDVNKWLTFANSLRLRLALRVKYADPALAKAEAEKAVADGVMLTAAENANVFTNDLSKNNLGTIANYDNWRMSATMESVMVGFNDPRLDSYWNPVVTDNRNDGSKFHGIRNGLPIALIDNPVQVATNSKIDTKWWRLEDGGTNPPYQVMRAEEVYFLRAEGAVEGWNMGGTAKELYDKGIEVSISSRTAATAVDIANYLKSTSTPKPLKDQWNTPAVSDIPVAFMATGPKEKQLEQIGTQKWIGLFPDGWEAWAEMRRTGYPKLLPRIQSENPDVPANQMIRRLLFVDGEYANNNQAVTAALTLPELAAKGGNKNSTKLWWDAK